MNIFKLIYLYIIENVYCKLKGHKYTLIKDIKVENVDIPFDGVQLLKCEHCERINSAWYIDTKDNKNIF